MKKICILLMTVLCLLFNANSMIYAQNKSVTFSFPIKIKWGHGGLDREQKYELKFKGLQEDIPMPKGSTKNQYIRKLSYPKDQKISKPIPDIIYTNPGDHEYKLTLLRRDKTVIKNYYLHIQVLTKGNGELFITTSIHKNQETGQKITSIQFLDPEADEPLHNKDQHSKEETEKKQRQDEYYDEHNKNNRNNKNEEQQKERSTRSTKTGDEMKIEFYLMLSIVSLGVILVVGCKKISDRK